MSAKIERVTTPLGAGVLTGNVEFKQNGTDCMRFEVELDEQPAGHDKRVLWFYKSEVVREAVK
jgi:hypothetical protein